MQCIKKQLKAINGGFKAHDGPTVSEPCIGPVQVAPKPIKVVPPFICIVPPNFLNK
jgi:hypothetical protein